MLRDKLEGERFLVTGASGFLGSSVCRQLSNEGLEVHGVSRTKPRMDNAGQWKWWQGDLADSGVAKNLVTAVRPHVIIHLAGDALGSRELRLVDSMLRGHVLSTVNLLTVATEIGCRRIVVSGSLEEPNSNDSASIPSSPYAAAKWASSAYARMFHALYGLPVVILRVFMVYGPAPRDQRKLIPYVILSLLQGERPQLAGGEREIDWVYLDDVVSAFKAACIASDIEGQTIDVGSGQLVRIRTVVQHLADIIDPRIVPVFGALPERQFEQVRVADTKKAQALMGWTAATPLEKGLQATVEWFEQQTAAGIPK
jgi:UDP-glucose 4-epimerase